MKNNFQNSMNQQHEHGYNTRYNINVPYPRHCLTVVYEIPHYFGRQLLNKLPHDLKNIIIREALFQK